ncbi:hypothetical protein T05_3678 [Trichinella murrelli]|uniref:Uncharacterized protein n=1 Tax=Trichinella murrelli TaxID=144512 RepID=A0A0V0T3V6_9BILA|nr:hypothetical protein T05_3678 [Trichinella murrelli]
MCGQTGPCIQRNWSSEIVAFCGYLLVDLQHAISKNSILAEQRRDSQSGFGVIKSDNWPLKNNGLRGVDASG